MNDMIIDVEVGTALAVIPAASLPTLVKADTSDIIGRLRAELAGYVPDASTEAGRAEIGTKARKVGTAKQDFGRLAATLKADHQATIKSINSELKLIEDDCDAIRDGILAPRTEFLNRQKAIVTANEDAIAALDALVVGLSDLTSAEIEERIKQAGIVSEFGWAPEFVQRADRVFGGVAAQLHMADQTAKERETAAAAEIERRRQEAEEQRINDHKCALNLIHNFVVMAEPEPTSHDYRMQIDRLERMPVRNWQEFETEADKLRHDTLMVLIGKREKCLALEAAAQEQREREAAAEATRLAEIEAARQAKEAAQAAQAALQAEAERTRCAEEIAQRLAAQAESNRVAEHRAALAVMENLATAKTGNEATIMVDTDLATLAHIFDRDWAEFHDEAKGMHAAVEAALMRRHDAAQQRAVQAEADRKEAQRVRDEAAQTMAEAKARQELADKQTAEDAVAAKRAANRVHQAKINGEVLEDIVRALAQTGIDYDDGPDIGTQIAKAVITAVAKGEVRHIKIGY